jgi:MtN3 and saliva related transmembrane protein
MADADLATMIGGVATLLAVVSLVPQVLRTWRTRSAVDLSASWLVIALASMVLWIVYGTLLAAWAIVVANAATLFLVLLLLAMKFRFTQGSRIWAEK